MLVPATFLSKRPGKFFLQFWKKYDTVKIRPLLEEEAGLVEKKMEGDWNRNKKGSFNYSTWFLNEQFSILPSEDCEARISIDSHSPLPSGFYLFKSENHKKKKLFTDLVAKTHFSENRHGEYFLRKIFRSLTFPFSPQVHVVAKLKKDTTYVVVPCTFAPVSDNLGDFELKVRSTKPFELNCLEEEENCASVYGEWNETNAGGCANHRNATWETNPLVRLTISAETCLVIELSQPDEQIPQGFGVGYYVFKGDERPLETVRVVAKSKFVKGSRTVAFKFPKVTPGVYSISPCTHEPAQFGKWKLAVHSSSCIPKLEKI